MGSLSKSSWSRQPGTYVLVMTLSSAQTVRIGRLGVYAFEPGTYAYVGSALGPGGLGARLERHAGREKRPHWHVDYLLAIAVLREVWYVEATTRRECAWATVINDLPEVRVPVLGFGSSDCRCCAHLFFCNDASQLVPFARNVASLCEDLVRRTVLSVE